MKTVLFLLIFVILCIALIIAWVYLSNRLHSAELQIVQEQRRAEAAEKKAMEQVRLLGVISHELRSPLQTVVASVDLLLLHSRNDDEKRIIERLQKASEQIEAQVADLSTYSHILSGMLVLSPEPFNPQDELVMTVEELVGERRKKDLHFIYDFTDPEKVVVSDARRFRQIVTNLVTNAVKYAVPGKVFVSLSYQPLPESSLTQLVLTFEDSGPGISAELLPLIFNEFSQGKSNHANTAGIGMGLAIIARLVTLMGGTISVSSPESKGARFTVRLPVSAHLAAPLSATSNG